VAQVERSVPAPSGRDLVPLARRASGRAASSSAPTPAIWWDLVAPRDRPVPAAPLRGDVSCRTCIVGGGIAGVSLALALARRGDDVVLIERQFPGWGATGRNAGFLLADSDCLAMAAHHLGEDVTLWLRAAGEATRTFVRSVGAPVEWTGSVRLASDRREARWFEETAARGIDGVRLVDPARVAEGGPGGAWLGALADDGDGITNPLRVLRAIHRASERAGVRRFDGTPARELRDGSRSVEIETDAGTVRAARVVIATNSEARVLLGGDVAPIRPVRAQALAAFVDPAPAWRRSVYATRGGDYWRPLPGGRVLLGGLRRVAKPQEATRSTATSQRLQRALDALLRRLVGPRARIEVTHRWAGTMGFTKDGLPRIGAVPSRPRVHVFAGWNGHGMGWAPGSAEALAAHLSGDAAAVPRAFRPASAVAPRAARREST
jgi:glycine/D-amino acid oxidase-like deaminating enzyme